jgi:hypothetical protein
MYSTTATPEFLVFFKQVSLGNDVKNKYKRLKKMQMVRTKCEGTITALGHNRLYIEQ